MPDCGHLVQASKPDVAEGDGIVVTGEAEVTFRPVPDRMGAVVRKLFCPGHVAVEDDQADKHEADFQAVHGDVVEGPPANGAVVAAVGGIGPWTVPCA